jgi:hypothetical protein
VCDHKFNGHVLAACTVGGCVQHNEFELPSGTLTVARVDGGLEAAFAPTGQKPSRLTADFFTPEERISSRAQSSPYDTDDDGHPEVVMVDTDDDKPIVADPDPKKRKLDKIEKLEHRLTHPLTHPAKKAHYQPLAKKVAVLNIPPSVTEPEPRREPEPEQKEQPKVPKETKAPEPTGMTVAKEHADLAKLIKALLAAMSLDDACSVIATVAAFWHNGPVALGACIQSLVALKCSTDAIGLVATYWPRCPTGS